MRLRLVAIAFVFACLPAGALVAATISNTFDADAQGWVANVPEGSLSYSVAGGNPGGHLRVTDSGRSSVNGFASGAFFGPDFLGDLSAFDGGVLTFELATFAGFGGTFPSFGRVMLFGAGDTMPADQTPDAMADTIVSAPRPWTSYSVGFDATTFGVPQSDWEAILAGVVGIGIATDAFDAADTIGIDNVRLDSRDTLPTIPLPAGWLLGLTMIVFLAAMRRQS